MFLVLYADSKPPDESLKLGRNPDRGNLLFKLTLTPQQQQQQQQQKQKQDKQKKKKSRGNRKLQRYRAKLRKRGLNNETIATLISDYNNTNQGQNDEQSTASNMNIELLIPAHNQVGSIYEQKLKIKNLFIFR
jgi:hypothetical protein